MTTIDQFESVFRSAVKPLYRYAPLQVDRVTLVTDLQAEASAVYRHQVGRLLSHISSEYWQVIDSSRYRTTHDLLTLVEGIQSDLICCYRNLHSEAWKYPHSLGSHLDVLIQRTQTPVLVLPHPAAGYRKKSEFQGMKRVMVITDRLADGSRLVNHALSFCGETGALYLVHIEDQATFARYIEAIGKITTIDTGEATAAIGRQLLKAPADYIRTCSEVIESVHRDISVHPIVEFGHHLPDYLDHVRKHEIDLLVMKGKDDDQMAMHGMAYPIAIELRDVPVLII